MISRIVAAITAAVLLFCSVPLPASAQDDSGEIRIAVTDSNKSPLALARVLLNGPVVTSEITTANGEVLFTDVPDGIYQVRVTKRGYQSVTSSNFEVVNSRSVVVSVALSLSTELKTIAVVSTHSTVSVSAETINNDSAVRKLSTDLADALNKLSGVSVSTSSDDSDASQTISLEGHDASQTALTLDGIPLNAPGTAGNLRGFATDLFGSASVHSGPQVGGLGGGVSFSTLQPTLSWLSQATMSTGSTGKYNYSFAESGSYGKLGIAVQTVNRESPSLADGLLYQDASGLDYVHEGNSDIVGNLIKLRYQLTGDNTLTGEFLNSDRNTQVVCLRITNGIPCGYGPGNFSTSGQSLYSLQDGALIGDTSVQGTIYQSNSSSVSNELNRFVAGVPSPIGSTNNSSTRGVTLNATLPAKEQHTISITAYSTASSAVTTPLVYEAVPYYNGSQTSSYSAFQVSDSIRSNDKLNIGTTAGFSAVSGASGSVLGTGALTWKPTKVDTYTASYSVGGVAANAGRATILTDPAALRFTCNGDDSTASGTAPGETPGESSSISERIGYTRALPHGSDIALQGYYQVQNDVVLPIQVNGSELLANGTISPAYLALVSQIYDSEAGCGSAIPIQATQLYFNTPINGVRRVYEGGSATGYLTFGRLVVQPFYDINVSKALSNNPLIDNPYSITISGNQLPNVPLQRAGVVFDYKSPHSALEYLADAQFVAKNNPNNLPSYASFDAGVSAQLDRGTLTAAASNITNVYGGIFSSSLYAVPYTTAGGILIPTSARPLAPRSYSVTYSVKFGPGALGSSNTSAAFRAPRGANGGGPGGEGGPGGGGPGGQRGGGFRNLMQPLPSTPPTDPFAVSNDPQTCTAEGAKQSQLMSSELKSVTAQIEAAKVAGAYPATFTPPAFTDMTLTYHGLGSTYALTITPKLSAIAAPVPSSSPSPGPNGARGGGAGRGRGSRGIFGCLPLHIAQPDDIKARNLYAPTGGVPIFSLQIQFMPAVGLYVAARPQAAGQEQFRVYALPSAPPKAPFEVRKADNCIGDIRNQATEALGELEKFFAQGTAAPAWTITPHAATGGTWYELAPGDPSMIGTLLVCGRVAGTSDEELTARGVAGVRPPSLNYSPKLGLYIIRPQRPPGAAASPSPGASPLPSPAASPQTR